MQPDDHYIVITADSHAGGSHAQYREFLDPKYHDDFDAWRGKYKNPFKDLKDTDLRTRNWDGEQRDRQQNEDGVVGEVIFPNTVPPFFPSFVLFAEPPRPEEYEHRHAGVQAHNRWLADFCAQKPEARAGIGQIFLNDLDDAIADAQWCKDNGLRGGVLVGNPPITAEWLKPMYDPYYDPLWAACEEMDIVVNTHSGTGGPRYQQAPAMPIVHITEMVFYSQRPFVYMLVGGVFERFPNLKFVLTEAGCAWVPNILEQLDAMMGMLRTGGTGEMRFEGETVPVRNASDYFRQNCHIGMSQPRPADIRAALGPVGIERVMWGSDYPHEEGTQPFSREHLRQVMGHLPPEQIQQIVGGNTAELYGFDTEALRPAAEQYGPTVAEIAQPLEELPEGANEALLRSAKELARGALTTMRMRLEPQDDYFHVPDDDTNYNESRYYNFYDPTPGIGGWVRMGNRPNEGYAEMTVCLYLPDGRVGFMFKRPHIEGHVAHDAGGLKFDVVAPYEEHHVTYDGNVCILTNPREMADPGPAFKANPHEPCTIDLKVTAVAQPSGGEPEWDDGEEPPGGASHGFARGHTEQQMAIEGLVQIGDQRFDLDAGFGLRDHSWGPRVWQSIWWYRWITASFGPLGIACTLRGERDSDHRNVSGWVSDLDLYGDTRVVPVRDMVLTSVYDDEWYVMSNDAVVTTDDRVYEMHGEVTTGIPLRNRRNGMVTRLTESLTRFTCGEFSGAGLSEYLDQVVDDVPVGTSAGI